MSLHSLSTHRVSRNVVNFQLWVNCLGCPPLTCAAGAGGPLGGAGRAQVPVQGGVGRGQHPAVTQGGGGSGQGLAAQRPSRLVHGIGVGYGHCHVHGEALLRQRRGLQEGDRQRGRSKPKIKPDGSLVSVTASLRESDSAILGVCFNRQIHWCNAGRAERN